MQLATIEPIVTNERERELLRDKSQDFEELRQKSGDYRKMLRDESMTGFSEHMRVIYRIADYLGITNPDKRLQEKLKMSEASCTKQKLLSRKYDSMAKEQEAFIFEKEQELRECGFCYEKRKIQLEEVQAESQALIKEKAQYLQLLKQDKNSREASEMVSKISAQIFSLKSRQRAVEREKDEFASRIVECDAAVAESENNLVSLGTYSSVHRKSYMRSKIEIMRLKPLLASSRNPIQTIDSLVEDQKLAEQTESIADTMSKYANEIASDISDVSIRAKRKKVLYDALREKRADSVEEMTVMAERIIYERNQ